MRDNRGAEGSDSVVVTAANVIPVAAVERLVDETGAQIGTEVPVALAGLSVGLAGSFTDVGAADTHTASIAWGDGAVDLNPVFDSFADCDGGARGSWA